MVLPAAELAVPSSKLPGTAAASFPLKQMAAGSKVDGYFSSCTACSSRGLCSSSSASHQASPIQPQGAVGQYASSALLASGQTVELCKQDLRATCRCQPTAARPVSHRPFFACSSKVQASYTVCSQSRFLPVTVGKNYHPQRASRTTVAAVVIRQPREMRGWPAAKPGRQAGRLAFSNINMHGPCEAGTAAGGSPISGLYRCCTDLAHFPARAGWAVLATAATSSSCWHQPRSGICAKQLQQNHICCPALVPSSVLRHCADSSQVLALLLTSKLHNNTSSLGAQVAPWARA